MPIELLQAVSQHARYLNMVRLCLDKGEEHCLCTDHHNCKFGKWFYAEENEKYKKHADAMVVRLWSEIEEHHMRFHQHSLEAMAHLQKNDGLDEASAHAMKNCETEMMKRSTFLVNRLLELDAKVG